MGVQRYYEVLVELYSEYSAIGAIFWALVFPVLPLPNRIPSLDLGSQGSMAHNAPSQKLTPEK
jgi:hypothetical protein